MRTFVFIFLLTFSSLPAIADKVDYNKYFKIEKVTDAQNAFIALEKIQNVDVSKIKNNFSCSTVLSKDLAIIPIKDSHCINKNAFEKAWKTNIKAINSYLAITEMNRFLQVSDASSSAESFINLNRLIATKIELAIYEGDLKTAYSLFERNTRFLQMALSDTQTMVWKSILMINYGMYMYLSPSLLVSELSDAKKNSVRRVMLYKLTNYKTGVSSKSMIAADYNYISSLPDGAAIISEAFSEKLYELSEDSLELYKYDYPEIKKKAEELVEKYKVGEFKAFAMALFSKEQATADILISGITPGLELLVSAKQMDIRNQLASISY